MYMQARYYDPVIGRFYSNDPVDVMEHIARGNPIHGFGRYTYANNNPYKYVDPDGEFGILGAVIGLAIEGAVQIAQGELNVTKLAVATVAGGAGVGLGQKAVQLASILSNGSRVASTAAQVTGAVTEAVATNVIETSANNAINSITGANEMENIDASGATTNALANTATGNATGNLVSQNTSLGNKKVEIVVTAVVGVAEGARKVMTEVMNDDER
jgi:RHS repeat-associated protein